VWDSQSAELCSKGLFFKKVRINASAQSKFNAGTCPTFLPSKSWSSGSVWSELLSCFWSIILSLMLVYSQVEPMFLNVNFLMSSLEQALIFVFFWMLSNRYLNSESTTQAKWKPSHNIGLPNTVCVFVGMTNSTFPDHWAGEALVFNAGQCHDWVLPLLLKLKLWAHIFVEFFAQNFETIIFHPASGADEVSRE
jgi:hypothetical protein